MANTSAICNSFKQEVLVATHNFTASTGNTFKLALFDSSATLGASTTAYGTSEEITGTGYTAGGKNVTRGTPVLDSSTAVCDFGDVSWTSATFTANDFSSVNAIKVVSPTGTPTIGEKIQQSVTGGTA